MFKKEIWKLFKINRSDFNRFDKQVDNLLLEVYEKGKLKGRKLEHKRLSSVIKGFLK